MASKLRGIKSGQAFEGKDYPIKITAFSDRYETVVEATEGLQQLAVPPAMRLASGAYQVPVIKHIEREMDGRKKVIPVETWLIVTNTDYFDWQDKLKKSIMSFEHAGLYYATEKAKDNRHKLQMEDIRHGAESWIDTQRAAIVMEDMLRDEHKRLYLEDSPKMAEHMLNAKTALAKQAEDISANNLHVSRCEKLARERLLARGVQITDANWRELLDWETMSIYQEYQERDLSLKNVATQVWRLSNEIKQMQLQGNTARAAQIREQLLELLGTVNYSIATDMLNRLSQIESPDSALLREARRLQNTYAMEPSNMLLFRRVVQATPIRQKYITRLQRHGERHPTAVEQEQRRYDRLTTLSKAARYEHNQILANEESVREIKRWHKLNTPPQPVAIIAPIEVAPADAVTDTSQEPQHIRENKGKRVKTARENEAGNHKPRNTKGRGNNKSTRDFLALADTED